MVEDKDFNAMIRGALEASSPFALKLDPVAETRRLRRQWWRGAVGGLVAASFALVALFRFGVAPAETPVRNFDGLAETIGFLLEAEGIDPEDLDGATPAEVLLAWQDAPCSEWL